MIQCHNRAQKEHLKKKNEGDDNNAVTPLSTDLNVRPIQLNNIESEGPL